MAGIADSLTLLRLGAAVALIPLVWNGRWTAVAVVLGAAWLSDALDGRLARRAARVTRFGRLDMVADTAVGLGLALGLIANGTLPDVVGYPALGVFGVLYLLGNVAASMLLQLTGYVPTLLVLWSDRPALWWLPFAVIAVVAVVDWRRLFLVSIPAFLRGISGRFEGRSLDPQS